MLSEEQKEARKIRKERRARGEYKFSVEARTKISKSTLGEKNPNYGETPSDATRAKISKAQGGKTHTVVTKAKMSKSHLGKTQSPRACKKISESIKKIWLDQQWYGTVAYRDPKLYCVIFNFEFRERCRAYWEYESVLSHKTQDENCIICRKPARLTVHHVYYQPKACCGWDEDLEGYYAMINLGTRRKPNIVRHNIKGDPNKFVALTHSEHGKIKSNKLEWIKKFEDMIEEQGGKCYLTKEEMVEYKLGLRMMPTPPVETSKE